jgi:leader peptidase (prepilin peptidase)/N-methyltransferase
VAKGRSHCPNCDNVIKQYDLIPILSYILLGGKCRNCKAKISVRYPVVEFLTGALAVFIVYFDGLTVKSFLIFILTAIMIAISIIDIDTMEVPNSLIISLIPLAVASVFVFSDVDIVSRLIGLVVVSLPMYGLLYIIEDAFGGADIKLFAILGFILGWKGILLTLFIAVILGAIVGVIILRVKSEDSKGKHIPFGPYICIGVFISIMFGNNLINGYLHIFHL